jgi:predicted nucleic acid-binding protein
VSLYIDTSALLAVLLDEPAGGLARSRMLTDSAWFTARHTLVEVRRNLAKLVGPADLTEARATFDRDWARTIIIELDEGTCEEAARIAEETGARSLDALHLASAKRLGDPGVVFLSFDRRQAAAARSIGLVVVDPGAEEAEHPAEKTDAETSASTDSETEVDPSAGE